MFSVSTENTCNNTGLTKLLDNSAILYVHTAQQLELAFSEDDYSTQEAPGSTINALITKSGQSSEVVTVRVIPTTFEQYRNQFGQVPFQDIDPAEGEKICMALLGRTKNE